MNKSIIILIAFMLFLAGCGRENLAKISNPINRTFEDLTLGMTTEDFKNRVAYVDITFSSKSKIAKVYETYSVFYNIYGVDRPKMKELDNIYQVHCYFFDDKLCRVEVNYSYRYMPSWDNFIYNAKQKYGRGEEDIIGKSIEWNDGKTILVIKEEFGEQFDRAVSYYSFSYTDVETASQIGRREQEISPKF